jgi:hypothetical protein
MGEGCERSTQAEMSEKAKVRSHTTNDNVGRGLKECEQSYKREGSPSASDLSLNTIVSKVEMR